MKRTSREIAVITEKIVSQLKVKPNDREEDIIDKVVKKCTKYNMSVKKIIKVLNLKK